MMILSLFAFAGGGAVLLTGCDSSQSTVSDENQSGDGETEENPNDESDNSGIENGSDEDTENSEENTSSSATSYYYHAYVITFDSASPTGSNSSRGGNVTIWAPGFLGIYDDVADGRGTEYTHNSSKKDYSEVVLQITDGYTFGGWYTNEDCTNRFYPSSSNTNYDGDTSDNRVNTGRQQLQSIPGGDSNNKYIYAMVYRGSNIQTTFVGDVVSTSQVSSTIDNYYSLGTSAPWGNPSSDDNASTVRFYYSSSSYVASSSFTTSYTFGDKFYTNYIRLYVSSYTSARYTFRGFWYEYFDPYDADGGSDNWVRISTSTSYTLTTDQVSRVASSDQVYAVYEDYHTITYDENGGSSVNDDHYASTSSRTLPTPTLTGYTFNGWKVTKVDSYTSGTHYGWTIGNVITSFSSVKYGNVTLTAQWTPTTYSITFNPNGGTANGSTGNTIRYYNIEGDSSISGQSNVITTLPSATRNGYTFNGWRPSSSTGGWSSSTNYASGTSVRGKYSNITMTAQWSAITYTLTFYPNGGTANGSTGTTYRCYNTAAASSISGAQYSVITSLPTPTRTGWTFNGWRAGSNSGSWISGTNYNSGLSLNGKHGSVTLTAQWTAKTYPWNVYVMTQGSGGGSYGYSTARTGVSVSVTYTTSTGGSGSNSVTKSASGTGMQEFSLSLRANCTNANYRFIGFTTSNSAPTATSNPSTTTSVTPTTNSTRTYYAWFMYVSTNQILYDSSGGYYYYEDGEYPQTRVTNQTTINALNRLTSATYSISYLNANGTNSTISVYAYSGARYGRATNPSGTVGWFTVEPIKWRIATSNWGTYGRYNTNFVAVSDLVLGFGAIEETHMEEGSAYTSTNMYSNISAQRTREIGYAASTSIPFESFASGANLNVVTSTNVSYQGIRAVSTSELTTVLGSTVSNWRARCSDMVAFMLGVSEDSYVDYWTRNLGTMLDNGTVITAESGEESNAWVHEVHGVRFSITCSQGSRY